MDSGFSMLMAELAKAVRPQFTVDLVDLAHCSNMTSVVTGSASIAAECFLQHARMFVTRPGNLDAMGQTHSCPSY